MPEITAAAVKALRERTGLPMMECKKALQETGGDEDGRRRSAAQAGHQDAGNAHRPRNLVRPDRRLHRRGQEGRRDDRAAVRKRPGGRAAPNSRNSPTIWPSNWPPVPAPKRPTSCWRSRRRRKPGQTLGRAEGRPVQPHSRGVQRRPHRADRRPCGGYAHHDGTTRRAGRSRRRQRRGGQGYRHAHRGAASRKVVAKEDLDPADGRQGARDSLRGRPQGRQAGEHHRQDGRRPAARTSTPSKCCWSSRS